MLDAAPCGLLQTSVDGTFLRVNKTFCAWLDYTADSLVGKRKFQELLTMGGRIFHQTHWSPLLQMQGSISEVKLELKHRDGSHLPMVVNAIRREEGGRFVHELAAYVARDRDKYERELVRSRQRLEEMVTETSRLHAEAKDRALFAEQMIGIVSHDLRNPVSTIQMAAALLGREMPEEQRKRTVARIARASGRAGDLISDLLDFTQARLGGGMRVARKTIDLHATVHDAVDELSLAYAGRALRHVRAGDGACQGDPDRLAQLVGNLVSNAMAYGTRDAPVTVTSAVEPDACSIAVHNEGDPIPARLLEALFQPMARGTQTLGSKRSVGLGLFIVSEITRAHSGTLHVTSSAGAGTTFHAVFPRQAPAP